jgi:hypothetical protein
MTVMRTRGERTVDPTSVVDAALCMALRREIFTADEALELLRGVQNKVRDSEEIRAIVAEAEESDHDAALIARSGLVDRLLDMRLVLSR